MEEKKRLPGGQIQLVSREASIFAAELILGVVVVLSVREIAHCLLRGAIVVLGKSRGKPYK